MPNFASAIRTNKIPVIGLTPEASGTAPTSPVDGQLWTDTGTHIVKQWDAGTGTWIPWLRLGTVAGSAPDATTVLLKANNLSDLTNASTARTNLGLGTAATQNKVAAGSAGVLDATDPTTTNTRTPTDNTVTGGTPGAGVKIQSKTITAANVADATLTDTQVAAANKDGVAATPSLRTLGSGAQQALAGNTRLDQISAPTAPVSLNGQRITNLGAPTTNTDAARLVDVQGAAAGIDAQPSVRVASTANVSVATGLVNGSVVDGVTLATGDRVLLKNQTTGSENGVYIVAASGAASRATDNISANTFWFAEEGTANADTQWVVTTNNPITTGTTSLVISQFGAATNYVGTANRITISGTAIDISINYVGQTSITTLGTVTTGTWNGTAIAVANGGTGATDAATARANLGASKAGYAATLGAVTAGTAYTVTHNLATQDVIVQVRDASTNEHISLDIINASPNTVTITSGIAYAANALRIVVLPVA